MVGEPKEAESTGYSLSSGIAAGFSKVYAAHSKGIVAFGALYSLLFMYFQQTLLIDGLSFTSSGPFNIRLPAGESVIVSTSPPIPSGMPFPLWGPFLSK